MGIIDKKWTFGTGAIDPEKVNENYDDIFNEFNGDIDADNLGDYVITDRQLNESVSPVKRWEESFQDYVVSGCTAAAVGLACTVAGGIVYVDGVRKEVSSTGNTVTDETTTYVDVTSTGAYSWNSNTAPAAGYLRLAKFVATGGGVTTTDLRNMKPVNASQIESGVIGVTWAYAAEQSTTSETHVTLLDFGTVNVKKDDVLLINAAISVDSSAEVQSNYGLKIDDVQMTSYFHTVTTDTWRNSIPYVYAHTVTADNTALPLELTFKTDDDTITVNAIPSGYILQVRQTG